MEHTHIITIAMLMLRITTVNLLNSVSHDTLNCDEGNDISLSSYALKSIKIRTINKPQTKLTSAI